MNDIAHIGRLRVEAAEAALLSANRLEAYTDEELAAIYKGCGPEWMPQAGRALLTRALRWFEPAFLIHDVEFEEGGRWEEFVLANARLGSNCARLARLKCPWWNPRRYLLLWQARRIRQACEDFGWSAWKETE